MFARCESAIATVVGWLALLSIASLALAHDSPHHGGQHQAQTELHQAARHPLVPSASLHSDQDGQKSCKGTSRPDLSCDAISAQASYDQARDADTGYLFGIAQTIIGVATLGAAVAAVIWAKAAAAETRSGAKAAADQVALTRDAQRPWVSIALEVCSLRVHGQDVTTECEVIFKNVGGTVATHFLHTLQIKYITPEDPTIYNIGLDYVEAVQRRADGVIIPGDEFSTERTITSTHIAPGERRIVYGSDHAPWALMPVVAITCYYRSASSPEVDHVSIRCFKIEHAQGVVHLGDKTISAPALKVTPYGIQSAT
jgi:hypothetical protein